ncbi:zinc ribbon domain-containing protein [candidate division WWE3 bacterium]|nr:zinc ribbon domain-containing protein [candidate division WWE3 bacterium]
MYVELAQIGPEDYAPGVDSSGHPCQKATYNYVKGWLTAEEIPHFWVFRHPGLKNGKLRVSAFNSDVKPGFYNVALYRCDAPAVVASTPPAECPNCGAPIPPDPAVRFCDVCGTSLEPMPESATPNGRFQIGVNAKITCTPSGISIVFNVDE